MAMDLGVKYTLSQMNDIMETSIPGGNVTVWGSSRTPMWKRDSIPGQHDPGFSASTYLDT